MNRLIIVAAAVAVASCATSTNITAVWKPPAAAPVSFQRVIVAFQNADESMRRTVEDAMAANIGNATAAYTVLSAADIGNEARAKAAVSERGFDGAVVSRLVGVDSRTRYVPGQTWWGPAPYGTMWGYWGYGWRTVREPGYLTEDSVVTLETNVYSVANDTLVWASRSETINPQSGADLVKSVVEATVARMKREGVLPR